jgi:hypothetical protein
MVWYGMVWYGMVLWGRLLRGEGQGRPLQAGGTRVPEAPATALCMQRTSACT